MNLSIYAALCAILSGVGNCILYIGYTACSFILQSVIKSVHIRESWRIGANDGYYGLAVCNAFSTLSALAVPSLVNYVRCKWVLVMSAVCFTFYFISFQFLNRYLYFIATAIIGLAIASFNLGYMGYLTEFSTRQTIERNSALSQTFVSLQIIGAGIVNAIITTINMNNAKNSEYREYSASEIKYSFATFAVLGVIATIIFACLPDREVENSIFSSNVRSNSLKEQFYTILCVLIDKRVLILIPFYAHVGIFFTFWCSTLPTALLNTNVLSLNVYLPAYFAAAFTVGSVTMCIVIMKMTDVVDNFCFKPLMISSAVIHTLVFALTVCLIPEWSTVRNTGDPSLLIQPRAIVSSLLFPTQGQQSMGASRFYHSLASSLICFATPSLSIYSYVLITATLMVAATIAYLYTCDCIQNDERSQKKEEFDIPNVDNSMPTKSLQYND